MRFHLNLDLVEGLAVVDTNHAANHLGDDDHVAKMRFDGSGLLLHTCEEIDVEMVSRSLRSPSWPCGGASEEKFACASSHG